MCMLNSSPINLTFISCIILNNMQSMLSTSTKIGWDLGLPN